MQPMIDYIINNKDWIFSGIGIFALSSLIWLIRHLMFQNSPRNDGESSSKSKERRDELTGAPNVVPEHWQGILPPQSRYKFKSEHRHSIPLGLQSFSLEYGPQGHANALILKGQVVRAKIQFTCRIVNPEKALFGANEYALNVLPPRFLLEARSILEEYSLVELREERHKVSRDIIANLSPLVPR